MSIFNSLSPEYRLYLESMLPWMNEKPIGEEYFTDEMINQMKESVLAKYQDTGETSGMMSSFEPYYDVAWPYWMSETGSYNPDWNKDYERLGIDYKPDTTAQMSRVGDPNTLYNTLGTYNYEIGPRHHTAPRSVTITDRYDWNPEYTTKGWRGKEGTDVNTSMMAKGLYNLVRGRNQPGDVIEMFGNYMGHRQSEGKGRNINLTIPLENQVKKTPTVAPRDYTYTPEGREGYTYGL
jgi:hypothetical protein